MQMQFMGHRPDGWKEEQEQQARARAKRRRRIVIGCAAAAVVVLGALAASIAKADGFGLRDITETLNQVNRAIGNNGSAGRRPNASYVAPGTLLKLDDGRRVQIYGYECAPREQQPCSSIKVDNSTHRVLVVPQDGSGPFEERWSFKKLQNDKLVFRRPKGGFVTAAD